MKISLLIMEKSWNFDFEFLWESCSFFQVARTTIKSGQSSNLGQIGPRATELAALERIKKFHRLIMGEMLLPLQRIQFSLYPFHYTPPPPPQSVFVGGYTAFTLSDRPTVCPKRFLCP